MTPTIGRIVHYVLSANDVEQIKARGRSCNLEVGKIVPAVIVAVWSDQCVNLNVLLDGDGTYWATSRAAAVYDEPTDARWFWPPVPA